MKRLLPLLLLTCPWLNGFVLLSGPSEAKLDVSRDKPTAEFVLADDLPRISGKNKFLNGKYADLNDQEFWEAMVKETMAVWNNVADSYVQLTVTTASGVKADGDDNIHSIVSGSTSASASAFARPKIDGSVIRDCDITIGKATNIASSLAFTLLHELGHCLGLGHNHSNYDAVMGYSRTSKKLRLGLDDEVGLVYLYPNDNVSSAKETLGCAVISSASSSMLPLAVLLSPLIMLLIGLIRRHRTSERIPRFSRQLRNHFL